MKIDIFQSTTINVYANKFWNESDFEVKQGEEYRFSATGFWTDLFKKTDASGYSNWYMNLYNSLKRSKDHNCFALIGCLNKSNDFLIGTNNQLLFQKGGKLSFYANDVKWFYWNNFGRIVLQITRIK